jgi:hypothetical protein
MAMALTAVSFIWPSNLKTAQRPRKERYFRLLLKKDIYRPHELLKSIQE